MEVAPRIKCMFPVYTVYTGCTVYTFCTVYTVLFLLFKLFYTVETIACVPIYIGKVRTLLEWAAGLLRKMLEWVQLLLLLLS